MNEDTKPLMVSIWCITYNHEPYIRQCLEGFVMQKTNFRFEAIVHDDASTDGTAAIVREYAEKYPDIIKPILETENQYSKQDGSLDRIMNEKSTGKYIALCEGDDYWIDPLKLQKQVDFLESNNDYGMCYGKVFHLNQKKGTISSKAFGGPETTFDEIIKGSTIPTLTVLYRNSLRERYYKEIQPETKGWLMGDYPQWLFISCVSKIKFLDETLGVYRVLTNSVSHFTNYTKCENFLKSDYEMRCYMIENLGKQEYKNQIDEIMMDAFIHHSFVYRERLKAIQYLNKKKSLSFQQHVIKMCCKTRSSFFLIWLINRLLRFNKKIVNSVLQ